jgi:hypothetical protein
MTWIHALTGDAEAAPLFRVAAAKDSPGESPVTSQRPVAQSSGWASRNPSSPMGGRSPEIGSGLACAGAGAAPTAGGTVATDGRDATDRWQSVCPTAESARIDRKKPERPMGRKMDLPTLSGQGRMVLPGGNNGRTRTSRRMAP